MSAADYQVFLRDAGLNLIAQTRDWLTLDAVQRFNTWDTWQLTFRGRQLPDRFDPTQPGGVVIYQGDELITSGPWTYLGGDRTEEHPAGIITLAGVSDAIVIADRVAYPDPTHAASNQTAAALDTRTGIAETVIRAYVAANIGSGAITARKLAALTQSADTGLGSTVTGAPDMGWNLADLCTFLALVDGLGWDVTPDGPDLVFGVFDPVDLSATVRYDFDEGDDSALHWEINAPLATRELTGSSATGTSKTYTEVADTAAETLWDRRVEKYADGGSTVSAVLTQTGNAALVADEGTVLVQPTLVDLKGAHLGDLVTCAYPIGDLVDRLQEIRHQVTADGKQIITPTVGPPSASAAPKTTAQIKTLLARLTRLEARS